MATSSITAGSTVSCTSLPSKLHEPTSTRPSTRKLVFRREGASPIFRSIWEWNHGTDSSVKHPDRPDYVRVAVRPRHCLRHGEAVVIQHVDVAVNQRRQARLLGRGSALVHQSEEGQSEVMAGL